MDAALVVLEKISCNASMFSTEIQLLSWPCQCYVYFTMICLFFLQQSLSSKMGQTLNSFKCLFKFSFAALPFDTCHSSWRAASYMALTWSFCFLTSFLLPLPHVCRYCDFLLCGHKFLSDNHNYFTDGLAQMASRQKMVNYFPSMTEGTTGC